MAGAAGAAAAAAQEKLLNNFLQYPYRGVMNRFGDFIDRTGIVDYLARRTRYNLGLGPVLDASNRRDADIESGLVGRVFMQRDGPRGGQYYAMPPGAPAPPGAQLVYTPQAREVDAGGRALENGSSAYMGALRQDTNAKALSNFFMAQVKDKDNVRAQIREEIMKHNADGFGKSLRDTARGVYYGTREQWSGNAKFLTDVLKVNTNALQVYYVTVYVPAEYYDHPLCRTAMIAPLEGGEFYNAFQRIMIHVGMDRLLQAYAGMMRHLAEFEHYCVIQSQKDKKFSISMDLVDLSKLKFVCESRIEGEMYNSLRENADITTDPSSSFKAYYGFLSYLAGNRFSDAVATYAPTLATATVTAKFYTYTVALFVGGVTALATYWYPEYKLDTIRNPEKYGLVVASILSMKKRGPKTEFGTKMEVFFRLEQIRYKMNLFSSFLAGISTKPDMTPEEIDEKAKEIQKLVTSSNAS